MALSLDQAMREVLAGWRDDLDPAWLDAIGEAEPGYDRIDPALLLEPWEPVFPARRGRTYPGAPKGAHIFRAFDDIRPPDVRVVILGQDPYPCAAFATGRAFEAGNVARWRELEKMFSKSIRTWMQLIAAARTGDAGYVQSTADWERQGVLLLNSSFTLSRFAVEGDAHQVRGHLPLWRPVVAAVLRHVAARGTPVVFLGFGGQAADALAEAGITEDAPQPNVACILREHPARAEAVLALPNPFVACNSALIAMGAEPVSW